MSDELASLGISIDGGGQAVVDLDKIAESGDKADASVGGLARAMGLLTEAVRAETSSRAAQVQASAQHTAALQQQDAAIKQAVADTRTLVAAEKEQGDAATQAAAATREAAAALAPEGAAGSEAGPGLAPSAARASTGIRGLGRPLTSLLTQIDGAPPIVGRLGYALSMFSVGGPVTIGVIAGLAIIGGAYDLLTADARKAQKQIDDSADAIRKLRTEALSAPIRLEIDIEGAKKKLAELRHDVASIGQRAGGTLMTGGGLIGLGYELYRGNRAASAAAELAPGLPIAEQRETDETADARAKLLATGRELQPQNAALATQARALAATYRAQGDALGILTERGQHYLELAKQLTAQDDKDAKAAAAKEKRDARAEASQSRREAAAARRAQQAANRSAKQAPREQAAAFGEMSDISSGNGTNLTALMTSSLGATSAIAAQQRRIDFSGLIKPVKADLKDALKFFGDKDELEHLINTQKLQENLTASIGDSLANGIGAGFDKAFASGSLTAGFDALGKTMLGGLGDAFEQFGIQSLKLGTLMQAIKASFQSFLPGGGIAAAVAMIAIGAGLKAAAGSAFGGSGGSGGAGVGSYGGATAAPPDIIDRGVIAGAYGGVAPPRAGQFGGGALGTPQPFVQVPVTLIGTNDPTAQRNIVELIRGAVGRGYSVPGIAGTGG